MRVVLDTHVLLAGLVWPFSHPGAIMRMVSWGAVALCLDARILAEYRSMLARSRFGFDPNSVAVLLDFVSANSVIVASRPLAIRLPDEHDEPFLEVALGCAADYLVTANLERFPQEACCDMPTLTPAEFVARVRSECGPEEDVGRSA